MKQPSQSPGAVWFRERYRNDPVWRAAYLARKRSAATRAYGRAYYHAVTKAKHAANPNVQSRQQFENWNVKRRGFAIADIARWLHAHDRKCGLCGLPLPDGGRDFCVDHDHKSGEFRGVLHQKCNLLVGYASDYEGLLFAASEYLRRWRHARRSRAA